MYRLLPTIAALLLPLGVHAAERVCLQEVSYRLVGEDAPAPEKARMVEEQVLAGAEKAGFEVLRGECSGGEVPVLAVSVAESGALYDIAVAVGEQAAAEEQFTGPFAGMLKQIRSSVEAALAEAAAQTTPEPEPEAEPEPEPEPEPEAEPEGGSSTESASAEASAGLSNSNAAEASAGLSNSKADELNPLWASSLALTVVGGAAMIAGVVLLLVDDPCIDEDPDHGCRERFDSSAAGIPLAGLGGIAVGVGIAGLVLLDRRVGGGDEPIEDEAPEPAAALVPLPGGAAAGLSWSF
jgi:hypothetical protein